MGSEQLRERQTTFSYGALLPVGPEEAFTFVSDPATWPLFVQGLRSAEPLADWGKVGGRGRMVTVFMRREIRSELELTEWDPPRAFRYVARQPGRPDLDNRRAFDPIDGATRLTGTTSVQRRSGLAGVLDRISVSVLRRLYARSMTSLPTVIRAASCTQSRRW